MLPYNFKVAEKRKLRKQKPKAQAERSRKVYQERKNRKPLA